MEAELLLAQQEIVNHLLKISIEDKTINELYDLVLREVVKTPWMQLSKKGGFFTYDPHRKLLKLTTTYEFSKPLLTLCSEIKLGQCLCGRAAESKEVIFKPCLDEDHDIHFDEMQPHGHYSVPILSETNELLAVMVLYVPHGHVSQVHEVTFLEEVASTVANMIQRKKLELELISAREKEALNALVITYNHEINNPLTIAMGNLSKLKDHENQEAYQKLKTALQRIQQVVADIRELPLKVTTREAYADLGEIFTISHDLNFPIHILESLDKTASISASDKRGNITYINELFCAISGFKREELIGKNYRVLKSGKHPREFFEDMWKSIIHGQIWHGEVCNKRKNGEFYWVDSRIIPYRDGYISINFDITHLKK